jgi:hypothetical protein
MVVRLARNLPQGLNRRSWMNEDPRRTLKKFSGTS